MFYLRIDAGIFSAYTNAFKHGIIKKLTKIEGEAMNRIKQNTLKYCFMSVVYLMVITFISVVFARTPAMSFLLAAVLILIAFLPNRIQGFKFRDFYNARNVMSKRNYKDSTEQFEAFLKKLKKDPSLQKYEKFMININTKSILALTENSLGASYLMMGDLSKAEEHFEEAIKADPMYATPHYNLGLVSFARRQDAKGKEYYDKARALGLRVNDMNEVKEQVKQVMKKVGRKK